MLSYFFQNSHLTQVQKIIDLLNNQKNKLEQLDFSQAYYNFSNAESLFEEIKQIGVISKNEKLANSQYVAKMYFRLFCDMASYFSLLSKNEYKSSWNTLQDCFDSIYYVGKFTDISEDYELFKIKDLLKSYEGLYQYKIFASSEYIILSSACSLCGKPMQSLECPHIKGNLYWGEMAIEKISKVKEFQAVALVSNPVDKRCVMELADDNRSETEKFKLLDTFCKQNIYPFKNFLIEEQISTRLKEKDKSLGRNDKCNCGSGKKYKRCCGLVTYYEHHHYIIKPLETIKFIKDYVQ